MQRKTPLKATKVLARRTPLRASTPLAAGSGLRRTPPAAVSAKRVAALKAAGKKAKRARYTGPDAATVELVHARDLGRCAYCGDPITGQRGWDWSWHHRRPRRAGGSRLPDTNLPSNGVLLCGHGASGCHGEVERERIAAVAAGFLLHASDDPAMVAIEHAVHGRVWLAADGSVLRVRPEAAA